MNRRMKKLLRRKLVAQERSTIKNSRVKRNIVPAPFLSLPFLPVSVQPLIVRGVGKAARLGRLYSLVRHPGQSVTLRAGGKGEFGAARERTERQRKASRRAD